MIPDTQREKVKLFVVIGVLAICGLWLLIYTTMFSGPGYGKLHIPDTPAIRLVGDLNKKIAAEVKFSDVSFVLLSEKPVKLKAVGAVHTDANLDDLKEWVKQADPNDEFEYDVQVMGGQH